MKLRTSASRRPAVVVVGSLNVDSLAKVPHLPAPGETVSATNLQQRYGGKGANQAVAAARQGADVAVIGCVGDDPEGTAYRQRLAGRERISVQGVRVANSTPTGRAFINVDSRGENQIVVIPGANAKLSAADVRAHSMLIQNARVLLAQLEVPVPAVLTAFRLAKQAGVTVILNPSPLRHDFPWGRRLVDTLIVNELEARAILGSALPRLEKNAPHRRAALERCGIRRAIITRGARPTLCLSGETVLVVPTLRVSPVDTVGAGDAFAGTFAARLASGTDWSEAVAWANCAGALATLRTGAQEAMPGHAATKRALAKMR